MPSMAAFPAEHPCSSLSGQKAVLFACPLRPSPAPLFFALPTIKFFF